MYPPTHSHLLLNTFSSTPTHLQLNTFSRTSSDKHPLSYILSFAVACGACLYGSIVPFWFIASAWLQLTYHLPLAIADGLTVLPEGMIAVVSVFVNVPYDITTSTHITNNTPF